jgi:hypothetical protein
LTLDLVGDAEWPEAQIMMWATHDDDLSLFRATLSYDLPELIEQRRLEFTAPTDLPDSFGLCGYPITGDMLGACILLLNNAVDADGRPILTDRRVAIRERQSA